VRLFVAGLMLFVLAGCVSTAPVGTPVVIPTFPPAAVSSPVLTQPAVPVVTTQPTAVPTVQQTPAITFAPPPATPSITQVPLATRDPSAPTGTRDNPYALGSQFELGDWAVTVDAVDLDAWPEIQAENQFNAPPAAGRQFVMFHVTTTYAGTDTANAGFDLNWAVVGSLGNTFGGSMDDYCGVIPEDLDNAGELFAGATAEGNVCVSVDAAQIDGATIQVEQFLADDSAYVALQAGDGVPPPATPSITQVPATRDPSAPTGTRDNPYPLGSQFELGDWSVTVNSVDLDAWPEIEAENPFNEPPAAGRKFVMFHATTTYNGTETGDVRFDLDWGIVGSLGNTFGLADYCGVIPDDLNDAGELFPGATAVGNVCVSAESAQIEGATIQVEQFLVDPVYVALE
jgi:hypothetical protein